MRPNRSKHKRKTEEQFFQVEAILDERRVNDQLTYKVRWVGYPSSEDTWEPEENLVGVRNLIDQFHKRKQTSSPSSVTSHSSRKRQACSSVESNSSKSRQNSPSTVKRRSTKSRSGYYEYVPQNQLVASKTQFFNDISEGKVDLTSDLYSRVKNRRRHHQEESLSRPSSLFEMNDYKGGSSLTPLARHSEPSTPKNFNPNSKTPSERAESVASACSQVQLTKNDACAVVEEDPSTISNSKSSLKSQASQPSFDTIPPPSPEGEPEEPKFDPPVDEKTLDDSKETHSFEAQMPSSAVEEKAEEQSPCDLQYEVDDSTLVVENEDEPSLPRPFVQSAQKLMSIYRDLHNSDTQERSQLMQFPEVVPYNETASIRSLDNLLFAINNHHWSLLATQPIEKISTTLYPGAQHPLTAALIGGEGRPFLLRRLLSVVKNPNFIDPVSKWPLLMIAVFYGRIQAVKVLLEHGANPNSSIHVDGKTRTALGVAISTGNVDMVSLLILNGANPYRVYGDMTSMQFIDQLIVATTPKTSHDVILKPSTKYGITKDAARQQYSNLSRDPAAIPPPEPSGDVTFPRSPYLTAFPPLGQSSTTSLHMSFDGQIAKLPSPESLQCIYRLISSLHARLFREIDRVVSQWLRKVEMTTASVVDKGQWICLTEDSFKLTFPTPLTEDPSTVCVLFLIHGMITPPGCFHLWLGDDGPCCVEKVILHGGVEQRPLDRLFFVSTLFPLRRSDESQIVSVLLKSEREKGIGIVPLILRLKPTQKNGPILVTNEGIQSPEVPRLRQRQ